VQHAHVQLAARLAVLQQKQAAADGRADDTAVRTFFPRPFQRVERADSSIWKPAAAARKNRSANLSSSPLTSRCVASILQPRRMHIDERHHHAISARQAGVLVAECQRGFVA